MRYSAIALLFLLLPGHSSVNASNNEAEQATLPEKRVDTSFPTSRGEIIQLAAGADFQAALNNAKPGDTIELEAGATFQGPFTLPNKTGSDWIVIRSGPSDTRLPPPGTRVAPADSRAMAKLTSSSGSVLSTEPGAHHYRFVGLEISPATPQSGGNQNSPLVNLVILGGRDGDPQSIPHHIIFDRCYLRGDPVNGTRRGIAMNSRDTAVIDSWLEDFKTSGRDSQAIAGWSGPGPFKVVNNYIEGAAENILFGGADPSIDGLVPSDIEIRGNHFAKPLSWREGHPDHDGSSWTIKNLLELKNARRVLIDGNLFEYNWPQAQNGFAILFTVRNQDGGAPWSVVEDVTFSNNIVRHTGSGINILGRDNIRPSQPSRRIVIHNNLFDDVGGEWGGGRLFQVLEGVDALIIESNTALNHDSIILTEGLPSKGLVFRNNIVMHNQYGIIGAGTGTGNASLERFFPDHQMENNVIIGGAARNYPQGNEFPLSMRDVGFADPDNADYRLSESSRVRSANRPHPGVNFASLCAALSDTERPAFCRSSPENDHLVDWSGITESDFSDLLRSGSVLWDNGMAQNPGGLPGRDNSRVESPGQDRMPQEAGQGGGQEQSRWPHVFSGTIPDQALELPLNNIGVYDPVDGTIYSCVRIRANGTPASLDGVEKIDVALQIISEEESIVRVIDSRVFNAAQALNNAGQIPDCSGVFDTETNQYHDVIQFQGRTLQLQFEMIDESSLALKLVNLSEL